MKVYIVIRSVDFEGDENVFVSLDFDEAKKDCAKRIAENKMEDFNYSVEVWEA